MDLFDLVALESWFWVGTSILLAVLWSNLAWLFSPWADPARSVEASASLPERVVHGLANWRFAPGLLQGLRLLYYLGLPAAALFWGRDAVVARFVGLKRLVVPSPAELSAGAAVRANWSSWLQDLGWAALLGLGCSALLSLAALTHRKALADGREGDSTLTLWAGEAAREALYREVHWAFYRNAPRVAWGLYWGTWAGLGLVALEAATNPMWRRDLREPGRAWYQVSRGALAVLSSLLFLRTQNLWLALVLHWAISWGLGAVYVVGSPRWSDTLFT